MINSTTLRRPLLWLVAIGYAIYGIGIGVFWGAWMFVITFSGQYRYRPRADVFYETALSQWAYFVESGHVVVWVGMFWIVVLSADTREGGLHPLDTALAGTSGNIAVDGRRVVGTKLACCDASGGGPCDAHGAAENIRINVGCAGDVFIQASVAQPTDS